MKRKGYTFTLECLEEDIQIRGNCMASGDEAYDRACEDEIIANLESGNPWAWCCVRVTCQHDASGVEGDDYLGGCSYKSEEDFKTDGYYEDMCGAAFAECSTTMAKMRKALKEG